MTAEVVIMNKSAVALTADCAVTITSELNQKIYNTANKLFTLSKYHPVGIMVYANADLVDVAIETLIKIYREKLGNKNYSTLNEFAQNFISFLKNSKSKYVNEESQLNYFKSIIFIQFKELFEEIENEIEQVAQKK